LLLLGVGLREVLTDTTKAHDELVFYTVRPGSLPIVVTERGNLESQQTEQVICEVESFGGDRTGQSGTQMLFIVPNGSSVKKGDLLVELDDAPLKERLDAQFLALQRAEAEMIQANSKFENQVTQNETNLAEAELQVKLAKLTMESYEDESGGTFQIELQNVEMEIQNARAEQLIKKSDYAAVKALYDLGYKSKGDLAAARLDLLKADSALASQMARGRQLEVYTYEMQKLDRKGKYDTAQNNCEQVKRNNESELAQAKAAKESADRAYAKEKERYERYQTQLNKCKIYAPQDGMVAYATEEGRWNRGSSIAEGAFVRERQEILSIPNLNRMQVNTAVHESVLDQVKPGLKAVVRVDAFADRTYQGTVKSVAVLPDQGGWLASDTKVYKTLVTVDEDVTQLKPGMTAVVEIDIEKLTNVLSVPQQAIVQRADKNWCYVRVGDDVVQREIKLGKTNDKFVEIKQGLEDGDSVVLNPGSLVDEKEAAESKKKKDRRDEDDQDESAQPGSEPTGKKPADAANQSTDKVAESDATPAGAAESGAEGSANADAPSASAASQEKDSERKGRRGPAESTDSSQPASSPAPASTP
jgi:RND family efflux transporter MFP subunit